MVDAGAAGASGLNDVKAGVIAYKIASDLAKGHPAAQASDDAAPRGVDFRREDQLIGTGPAKEAKGASNQERPG
ncbi:hypothetical protein [Actinomadura sp. B10D3]|uniref:hypothetical protein n=1 Tax=Actinomadura sp. B10D3 TaxID=3153557 RepID=UPI00325C65A8